MWFETCPGYQQHVHEGFIGTPHRSLILEAEPALGAPFSGITSTGSLQAAPRAPFRVAAMRLRSLTSPTVPEVSACALRLPISRLLVWWGWLADPFILAHRSRRQGLRALWALAAVRPSSNL